MEKAHQRGQPSDEAKKTRDNLTALAPWSILAFGGVTYPADHSYSSNKEGINLFVDAVRSEKPSGEHPEDGEEVHGVFHGERSHLDDGGGGRKSALVEAAEISG